MPTTLISIHDLRLLLAQEDLDLSEGVDECDHVGQRCSVHCSHALPEQGIVILHTS